MYVYTDMAILLTRLYDFRDTPSSSLTISQFMAIDLEQEHDPPSFMVTKKKPKTKSDKVCTAWNLENYLWNMIPACIENDQFCKTLEGSGNRRT